MKTLKNTLLASIIFFTLLIGLASSLEAELTTQSDTSEWVAQSDSVFLPNNYSLRRPATFRQAPSRADDAPASAREARIGIVSDSVDLSLARLDKSAPELVGVNQPFNYDYVVTAKQDLKKVVVMEQIPEGAVFISATPAAEVDGNTVTWTLYDMNKGDRRNLQLTVRPEGVASLDSCATVKAYAAACTTVRVGEPVLELVKTTPRETVLLGNSVPWNITVRNTGDFPAREVVVVDTLPSGVSHESGQGRLTYNLGTLNPGESRSVDVLTTATESGEHVNKARVNSANAGSAEDDARIVVREAGLTIEKTTSDEYQFIGRTASYRIVVTNSGQVDLNNVVVVDTAPAETSISSAPGATVEGNTARWVINRLAAGDSRTFTIDLTTREIGTYCNRVTASESEVGLRVSDQVCTEWRGFPALMIEAIDLVDPLAVGEETTYVVTITNQGTAPDFNLMLVSEITREMEFVSATGVTPGTVEPRKISFNKVDRLDPGESIQFRIRARALEVGDVRFRADLTSDLLRRPVSTGEATQVY
jgi:uncharacterized repeat protein (TIGR01451 family)